MKHWHVITVGDILIDLTPDGLNTEDHPVFIGNPGGANANVACCVARLGGRSAFIGKVGADPFGGQLIRTLEKCGVSVQGVVRDATQPTTLAVVQLDESGERCFTFHRKDSADVRLLTEDVDAEMLEDCVVMATGSVAQTCEPSRSSVAAAMKAARNGGAVLAYDPNLRPALWESLDEAKRIMIETIHQVDLVKVSEEELAFLAGTTDELKHLARNFAKDHGIKLLFVTRGAEGALAVCGESLAERSGYKVAVTDTTGAGDAFFGAVLLRVAEDIHLMHSNEVELKALLDFACAAGSITTTRKGAIPALPDRKAVEMLSGK